jgi:hypothetical protein
MNMNKVTQYIQIITLVFILLSCSAFPSGRVEEPPGKKEARVFWVLDSSMSAESAEMFLERQLVPTSLAAMLWTEFTLQGQEVLFDTAGGYRVIRKQKVLTDPLGTYTVYGYNLTVDLSQPAPHHTAEHSTSQRSYPVRFAYPESADSTSGVIPQPLEQALLAGIRQDGRSNGKARVESIDYLGSGRFQATVLIGD